MAMSPTLLRPRATVHPEAAAWAARVVANGGTVGNSLAAVSKFCAAIASAGIRDRFYRLNLFCGSNLNAALVPLYRNYRLSAGRNEIQGEAFSGWTVSTATVTGGAAAAPAAAPVGAPLASSFKETVSAAAAHTMSFPYTATGSACVVSAYIKPDGRDWVMFAVEDAGGNPLGLAWFNLATLSLGSSYSGVSNAAITDAGNGWARISFQCTPTAGSRFLRVYSSTGNNGNTTVGDATKGYLVWGVQLEYGTTLTAYDSRPLGNTTDTNNAFVGVGTDYAETGVSGGLTGNGTSKYLVTGLRMDSLPSINSVHLSAYQATAGNGYGAISAYWQHTSDSTQTRGWEIFGTSLLLGNTNFFSPPATSRPALFTASRESSTVAYGYHNSQQGSVSSPSSVSAAAIEPLIFARNLNSGAPPSTSISPALVSSARLCGYSIGSGMTQAQVAAFSNAMSAFQTALGRV
jgi:hypothetical protein